MTLLLENACRVVKVKKRAVISTTFFAVLSFCFLAQAEEKKDWPAELSLEYALSHISPDHPQLKIAASRIDQQRASLQETESQTNFKSGISARLRWVEPSDIAFDQSQDDHRIQLYVNKPLYDFGRSSAKLAASQAAILSVEQRYQSVENQHRIAILKAYFDVLLADLAYARDNEDMSMFYVRMDRAKQRNELGQLSDIELMSERAKYEVSRVQRYRSSMAQRSTRAKLAAVLNRPGKLPGELQEPKLDILLRVIPEDIDVWLDEADKNNVMLMAYRSRVEETNAYLNAAKSNTSPVLIGNAEVSSYNRKTGSSDAWRAGVSVEVPLTTGGHSQAERTNRRAENTVARAELEQHRRDVHQTILEVWGELQALRVAREQAQAETEFRELYLDRSRALYELEVKSDLGDAMVKTTATKYEMMKTDFTMSLTWARLDALLGRKVFAEYSASPSVASPTESSVNVETNP